MPKTTKLFYSIIIGTFLSDRLSKYFLIKNFSYKILYPVIPGLNIFFTKNHGAAFGFLSSYGGWQRWLLITSSVSICALLFWWLKKNRVSLLEYYAFALIIGGALGNLYDRIFYGYVIDFIDFYIANMHWYTFNLADSAVCLGALAIFFGQAKINDNFLEK